MKQLLAVLIALASFGAHAKAMVPNKATDSIRRLIATDLKSPKTIGKANIDRINELAEEYFESEPDSTFKYAGMALSFAGRSGYRKGLGDAYANMAMVHTFRAEYALSKKNFTKALQIHRKIGGLYGMSEAYIGLGRVEDFLGNYPGAIIYLDSALTIRKKLGNEADLADCYNFIGITHDNKGEFAKALDYYLKALTIFLKHKNELASADIYCNIGIIMQHLDLYPKALGYFDTALKIWTKYNDRQGISTIYLNNGEVLLAQKRYAEAIKSLNPASVIFHDMNDQEGISLAYYDIGLYHYYTNQPDNAIRYLDMALASATKNKINYNIAHVCLGLAMVYISRKDYQNAFTYAWQAKTVADRLGSTNIRAEAYLQLSRASDGTGRHEDAYQQHLKYTSLKDSVKSNAIIQKMAAYDLEADFAKDQLEYRRRHQAEIVAYQKAIDDQHRANMIYGVIALLTGTIAVVYYAGKRRQTKINRILTEKNTEIIAQKNSLDEHSHKLNDLNRLKDRLIAVLAHDLRAPLSTLRGLFSLMADKDMTPEEFAEMAPKVFIRLENTSDFLDTLLFWINSQVDGAINTTDFCLSKLVHKELVILDAQLQQKSVKVINNVNEGDTVFADPNSIRIVVHNFLTNAIKFSPIGGEVTVDAYVGDSGQRVFRIKDRGVGMSPQQLGALFKSKVVSTPGTNNELGTGMGLLFCKDLIENYDGKIWAESESGKGASLYFSLPISNNATSPRAL